MRMWRHIGWAVPVAIAVLAASAGADAPVPVTLQALEAKMRALRVNSERFSRVSHGHVTVANTTNGKIVGRVKHVSLDSRLTTETSLVPQRSETFTGTRHEPLAIVIGSTLYTRTGGRRPWIRAHDAGLARNFAVYPFHGDSEEVDLGGTGSYTGLLNLLATATGLVRSEGQVTIAGQETEAFRATVEPLRLVKGLPEGALRRDPIVEHLEVFLTASGVPLRVVQSVDTAYLHITTVTRILAIGVPVHVKAPPPSQTRALLPPRRSHKHPRSRTR